MGNRLACMFSGSILSLRLYAYRFEHRLEDRRGLRFQKERLKGPVHNLCMALMIRMKRLDRFLPILGAIPHPNGALL